MVPVPSGKEGTPGPSAPRRVLGAADKSVDGVPLRLEVVGLHIGRRLVVVDLRLIRRRDKAQSWFTVGNLLDDAVSEPPDAVDGRWVRATAVDIDELQPLAMHSRPGGRRLGSWTVGHPDRHIGTAPGQAVSADRPAVNATWTKAGSAR